MTRHWLNLQQQIATQLEPFRMAVPVLAGWPRTRLQAIKTESCDRTLQHGDSLRMKLPGIERIRN